MLQFCFVIILYYSEKKNSCHYHVLYNAKLRVKGIGDKINYSYFSETRKFTACKLTVSLIGGQGKLTLPEIISIKLDISYALRQKKKETMLIWFDMEIAAIVTIFYQFPFTPNGIFFMIGKKIPLLQKIHHRKNDTQARD